IGPLFEKFGVAFVPAYILIDKDQRVAGLASLQPERDQLLSKSLGPLFAPKGNLPPIGDKGAGNRPKAPPGMPQIPAATGPVNLLVINLCTLLVFLAIFSIFAVILAFQAMQRGYNFGVWFLAGLLSLNPILLLVLLGLLPNRRMQRLRRMETELLEDLLDEDLPVTAMLAQEQGEGRHGSKTAAVRPEEETTAPVPKQSIGDVETQA